MSLNYHFYDKISKFFPIMVNGLEPFKSFFLWNIQNSVAIDYSGPFGNSKHDMPVFLRAFYLIQTLGSNLFGQ